MPTAIEFRAVSFRRPGGACVLDHFDLTVEPGEVSVGDPVLLET